MFVHCSLGIMFAEMVCCSVAIEGSPRLDDPTRTFASTRMRIVEDAGARLRSLWPTLVPVLRKCAAADPRARYTSAAAALADLMQAHPCSIPSTDSLVVNTGDVISRSPHLILAPATLRGTRVTAMVRQSLVLCEAPCDCRHSRLLYARS